MAAYFNAFFLDKLNDFTASMYSRSYLLILYCCTIVQFCCTSITKKGIGEHI
jgi:hypothetical protein